MTRFASSFRPDPTFQAFNGTCRPRQRKSETEPSREQAKAEPRDLSQRLRLGRKVSILGAIILAGCLTAVALRVISGPRSAFDIFWQPAFEEKAPLNIAMAHPIVYQPSLRAQQLDEEPKRISSPSCSAPY